MCYVFELLDEHVVNLSALYTASKNMLSTIHYRIQPLCRVPVTLGKRHSAKPPTAKGFLPSVGFRALGKDFAESLGTRQSNHVAPP